MIRHANLEDAQAICDIYNYYVLNTIVTFEEDIVLADDMADRIKKVSEKYVWLVYEQEGEIIGYAYAGEWKSRCSYRFSVESSVYLKNGFSGKGIGSKLYEALLKKLEKTNIHAVILALAPGNTPFFNGHCLGITNTGEHRNHNEASGTELDELSGIHPASTINRV